MDKIERITLLPTNNSRGGEEDVADPIWDQVPRDNAHIEAVREAFERRWYGYIDIGIGRGSDDSDTDELRRIIQVILEADRSLRG